MRPFLTVLSRATLNGASQVFLQAHQGCGLLILVAIGLHDLGLLAGALLGLLVGNFTAWRCGYSRRDIETGLYGYNAALLGLLIVSMLGVTPLAALLALFSSALSVPLQGWLLRCMRERASHPGLTLPFVLLGWLLLMLCGVLEGVVDAHLAEPRLDAWGSLGGILLGIGQVMFMAAPAAGLCLLAALVLADRHAGLWTLCGSAVGLYAALLTGADEPDVLVGLAGCNPALAALALSQGYRSALVPALGIGLAISFQLFFSQLDLPPLTMPFILACWVAALGNRLLCSRARPTMI